MGLEAQLSLQTVDVASTDGRLRKQMGGPGKGPLMHDTARPAVLKPGAKGMARLLGTALDQESGHLFFNNLPRYISLSFPTQTP